MQPTVFENAYFLQALGWAIANSLWQTALLWTIYKLLLSVNKNLSATFKYNLSVLFLFISFSWFTYTTIQNYFSLSNAQKITDIQIGNTIAISLTNLSKALPYLSVLYLFFLVFYTTKFFRNYRAVHVLQKQNLLKVPVDIRMFVRSTASHLGIKKQVQVWFSKHVHVPSVLGVLKPVILLPAALVNQLTTQQLEAILLHELMHIKRYDWFINLTLAIVETILFFNPFIHLLNSEVKKERENCCDDWVINFRYNKHDYASALLILEEQRISKLQLALAATNGKKNLLERIKRLFDTEPQVRVSMKQKLQITALGLVLITCIGLMLPAISKNIAAENFAPGPGISIVPLEANLLEAYPSSISEQQIVPVKLNNPVLPENKPQKASSISPEPQKSSEKNTAPAKPINKCTTTECTVAINKDYFNKKKENKIVQVGNSETTVTTKTYVKIEEQESGEENANIYYYEVQDSLGVIHVTPVIIMNKPVEKAEGERKIITL